MLNLFTIKQYGKTKIERLSTNVNSHIQEFRKQWTDQSDKISNSDSTPLIDDTDSKPTLTYAITFKRGQESELCVKVIGGSNLRPDNKVGNDVFPFVKVTKNNKDSKILLLKFCDQGCYSLSVYEGWLPHIHRKQYLVNECKLLTKWVV